MDRIPLKFILGLAIAVTPPSARGAIVLVQAAGGSCTPCTLSDGGTGLSVPFTAPVTAGNTLVIAINWSPAAAPAPVLLDSAGNTYPIAVGPTDGIGGFDYASLLIYSVAVDGGNLTTTMTGNGLTFLELIGAEYEGVYSAAPLDVAVAGASDTPPMVISPPLVTTTPEDTIVAFAFVNGCVGDAGAGFTWEEYVSCDGLEDGLAGDAGTYQASADGTFQGIISLAAFRSVPPFDAGQAADAGEPPDAGEPFDAGGAGDGGFTDAGQSPGHLGPYAISCDCGAASAGEVGLAWLAVTLVIRGRRKQRKAAR